MNIVKRFIKFKKRTSIFQNIDIIPVPNCDYLRIIIKDGRYYPQKLMNGEWITIICTNELGWFIAPKGFTGYKDIENANINIECAIKYPREAIEYYRNN